MEAPTPTRGAPAALQHIPAEALLEAALESEAKVAMLKEINEELIRYGKSISLAHPSRYSRHLSTPPHPPREDKLEAPGARESRL